MMTVMSGSSASSSSSSHGAKADNKRALPSEEEEDKLPLLVGDGDEGSCKRIKKDSSSPSAVPPPSAANDIEWRVKMCDIEEDSGCSDLHGKLKDVFQRIEVIECREKTLEKTSTEKRTVGIFHVDPSSGRRTFVAWEYKLVLQERSPVFRGMLESPMLEAASGEVCIRDEDISPESICVFLSFIRKGSPRFSFVDSFNAAEVWALADMYEVDGIKEYIMECCINNDTLCAAVQFAFRMRERPGFCPTLLRACSEFVADTSVYRCERVNCDHLEDLCVDAVAFLQEQFLEADDNPQYIFSFMQRWSQANGGLMPPFSPLVFSRMTRISDVKSSGLIPADQTIDVRVQFRSNPTREWVFTGLDPFADAKELIEEFHERDRLICVAYARPRTLHFMGVVLRRNSPLILQGIWCSGLVLEAYTD